MSDSKRQCAKCLFFQIAQLSGNGWCTHPKRQVASDVKILVREKELACRNSWGDDLWIDAAASSSTKDVVASPRKGLFYVNNRVDDEVTSVVDTTSTQADNPASRQANDVPDDIVTLTSVRRGDAIVHRAAPRPGENDLNSPAIADQAERARHMARGNKDAIQKARERHSQRRKPMRETIEAAPAEPASDQILVAQDREQYNRGAAEIDRAPADDYRNTPPVPREEVVANGTSLSPAHGTDERFDSIAQVKPEIDLTQLRGFLNQPGTPRRDAAAGSSKEVVTSYDLVLKRAREIKAAGDIERHHHLNAQNERKAGAPAQEPAPATDVRDQVPRLEASISSTSSGVVWDVEGERLNIAFERVREAIEHPAHLSGVPIEPTARIDLPVANTMFPPTVDQTMAQPAVRFDPTDEQVEFSGFDDSAEVHDNLTGPADDGDDWSDDPTEHVPGFPSSLVESPRGSWWRSLNFNLKRRYRSEPASAPAFIDDDEWVAEGIYAATDDDDGSFDCSGADDGEPVDARNRYEDVPPDEFDEADDIDVIFATSEESWLQDAWEFPQPQPVEWHQTRTLLLERSPMPVGEFEISSNHTQRYGDATGGDRRSTLHVHGEQLASAAVARHTSSTYAFDEPSGMDAFRSALFDERYQPAPSNGVAFEPRAAEAPVSDRTHTQESRGADPGPSTPDRLEARAPGGASGMPGHSPVRRTTRNPRYAPPQNTFDSDFDIRDSIVDQGAGVDRHVDVASRVPKFCSTCRSFRPSDNGERGWCMNDYAATHRQMVNSGDLACRSSIGDWWIAADTSWIPPTDVIQPDTPRTDRLVARSTPRGASASRSGQRVRTSKVG